VTDPDMEDSAGALVIFAYGTSIGTTQIQHHG
jgi:hypothetical protein